MLSFITFWDFYGIPVTLKIQNNNNRYKTIFGGIMSIFTIAACMGLTGYFLALFLLRASPTIIYNLEQSNEICLDIYKVPYMLRITDSYQKVHPEKERYWGIKFYVWTSRYNESDPNPNKLPLKSNIEIPMEVCNIDKHFGEYKEYFQNFTDLETFMCPNFKGYEKNVSLLGKYGEVKPNSYYMYYVYYCVNGKNNKTNCEKRSNVTAYLANAYLDVRTIDYSISTMEDNVTQTFIRNDRHSASGSVYKRIYQFVQTVSYNTDTGILFNDTSTENFFQLDQVRYETDIRDLDTGSTIPGTFVVFNLLNTPAKANYYRSYMKLHMFIANVGGVINGIMKGVWILTFFFLNKLYDLELVNSILGQLPKEDQTDGGKLDKAFSFNILNNLDTVSRSSQSQRHSTIKKADNKFSIINHDTAYKLFKNRRAILNLSFSDLYIPKLCLKNKMKKALFDKGRKRIIELLTIERIVQRFNDFDKLKELMLSDNQKVLFDLILPKSDNYLQKDVPWGELINIIYQTMISTSKIDIRLASYFKKRSDLI